MYFMVKRANGPELGAFMNWSNGQGRIRHAGNFFSAQLAQPFLEETFLRFGRDQGECPLVGGAGVSAASESPAQVSPRRMSEMVVPQLAARDQRIDERKPGGRSLVHRDCGGAVELNHG